MNTIGTHQLDQHHLLRAAFAAMTAILLAGGLQMSAGGDEPPIPKSIHCIKHV